MFVENLKQNIVSESYKKARIEISNQDFITWVESQIKHYSDKENFSIDNDFVKGKLSALNQVLRVYNKKNEQKN